MGKSKSNTSGETKFAKHTQDDVALANPDTESPEGGREGMGLLGKLAIFIVVPSVTGFLGLYAGYMESRRKDSTKELSFDNDFALPFALGLAMCVVLAFQTGGFSSRKPKPLVAWPTVKKQRKVVHKHVVKGQTEETNEAAEETEDKDGDAKKND